MTGYYDASTKRFAGSYCGRIITIMKAKTELRQQSEGGASMIFEHRMRISFDPEANAAYIHTEREVGLRHLARTVALDPGKVGAMINLDFDDCGVLLGIEILNAIDHLPPELLHPSED